MSFWKKFRSSHFLYSFLNEPFIISVFTLLMILSLSALFAPILAPHNPYDTSTIEIMNAELPPLWMDEADPEFILGTDAQGRDMLSTMLYGMRTSLIIGVCATLLQALIGIIVGLISGYKGGRLDSFLMRMADVQLSFSTLMVAIFLSAIFQAVFGVANFEKLALPFLVLVIGIAEWPQYARTVRASVLAEKKKEYIEAARVTGLSSNRIMWGHILPNSLSPILVLSSVQIAHAIMSEAALSFLGLGMPISKPSLGSLINSGFDYIFSGSWWISFFPGFLLVLLIMLINLMGDWIQDVLNPKLYRG